MPRAEATAKTVASMKPDLPSLAVVEPESPRWCTPQPVRAGQRYSTTSVGRRPYRREP